MILDVLLCQPLLMPRNLCQFVVCFPCLINCSAHMTFLVELQIQKLHVLSLQSPLFLTNLVLASNTEKPNLKTTAFQILLKGRGMSDIDCLMIHLF